MSDPVTNVEIEDVLSSIRRLVADGDGHRKNVSTRETGQSKRPVTRERFVLTPALRVNNDAAFVDSQDDLDAAEVAVDESSDPLRDTMHDTNDMDAPEAAASRKATIAQLEAAVIAQQDEWEPDGTGTQTDLSWASAGFRGDVQVEDAQTVDDAPTEEQGDGVDDGRDWTSQSDVGTHTTESFQREHEDGVSIADIDLSATPVRNFADKMTPPVDVETAMFTFRHKRADSVSVAPDEQSTVSADASADGRNYEDEMIGGDDIGPDPEDLLASYMADDAVIDEDALREIVTQIVREELQGDLGKRITRTVRKMVRQEINRALSAQDFS